MTMSHRRLKLQQSSEGVDRPMTARVYLNEKMKEKTIRPENDVETLHAGPETEVKSVSS